MKYLFWLVLFINILFFTWQTVFDHHVHDGGSQHRAERDKSSLMLLSERDGPKPVTATRAPEPSPKIPAAMIVGECFSLGPFKTVEDATGAVMQLKAQDVQSVSRKSEERVPKGYWVFLPPQGSTAAAKEQLRRMHQANIDSFLMSKGPMENAISVGIYNDLGHAEDRREELLRKGFNVVLEERFADKVFFWVDISAEASPRMTEELRRRLAIEFSGQRIESRTCER